MRRVNVKLAVLSLGQLILISICRGVFLCNYKTIVPTLLGVIYPLFEVLSQRCWVLYILCLRFCPNVVGWLSPLFEVLSQPGWVLYPRFEV